MLTQTARVALNTLANYMRFGISLVVFFLLTPFLIRKVGNNDFGLWSLSWAVLNCFTLMDLGFGTGVVKYVAECKGSNDFERRNQLLSTLAVVYIVLALLSAFAIYGFSLFFAGVFSISQDQHRKALALLWVLGARLVILSLPLGMFRGILYGDQRMVLVNTVQACSTVVYGFAAWIALARGNGVVMVAWINLAVMVLEHLAYVGLAFGLLRDLRISWRRAKWTLFKDVASFSAFAFTASVSSLVLLRTDPIIIKLFLPLSAIAVYAVGLRVAEQAYLFTRQFTYVLSPFVAELKGAGSEDKIRFVLVNCAKFALAPAIVLWVVVCAFSHEAIVFWVGPNFVGAAPVLVILMGAMALSTPTVVASDVFTMTGNPRIAARAATLSVILNIGVSVALVYPLGLIGVALGSLASTGIVAILMFLMACKAYRVRYRVYARRVLVSTVLPALFQLGATYAIKWWMPPTGLKMIAWEALPGAVLYGVIFWLFCVEPTEKRLFAEKLFKWRHGPEPPVAEKAEASPD